MISNQEINIKDKLNIIINEIAEHNTNKSKDELFKEFIEMRLNKSLKEYYDNLCKTIEKLYLIENETKIMKNLNKD